MDDTLYSASSGMFHQIHVLMDRYIEKALQLSPEQANRLRKQYWQQYGVTFYGLWLHHGIDPHDFLTQTHNVDIESVKTQGKMRQAVLSLPGQRILFTNAPEQFADRILRKIHLLDVFTAQYRVEQMKVFGRWSPKPSAAMIKKVLATHGVAPQEACIIDDNLNNLKVAHQLGLQTVLCTGWHHYGSEIARPIAYVDARIAHLKDIARLIRKPISATLTRRRRPRFLNPRE